MSDDFASNGILSHFSTTLVPFHMRGDFLKGFLKKRSNFVYHIPYGIVILQEERSFGETRLQLQDSSRVFSFKKGGE